MKNVNDFVKKDVFWPKTLAEQMEDYDEIVESIEKLQSEKEKYCKLISTNNEDSDERGLTFKEKVALYNIVSWVGKKGSEDGIANLKINWSMLRVKLLGLFDDLDEYISILDALDNQQKEKEAILGENITFYKFSNDLQSVHCGENHCLVRDGKELRCVCCGATTKDYSLSEEVVEFLTLCAKQQGILLEEFTKDDESLVKVLIEKQNYSINSEETEVLDDEEHFYSDGLDIQDLKRELKKAHLLDAKVYEDQSVKVAGPKYLSDKRKDELLANLAIELEMIKKSNSKFKDLLIEECKTAKYEILILSGAHIPSLFDKLTMEEEKIALTKAYYNISDMNFRINSGYFATSSRDWLAIVYDCITANPEINDRVLQMKLRKKEKHN